MVSVAVRADPVLRATFTSALPLFVPPSRATRTHGASLETVHAQPINVETFTTLRPPCGATRIDDWLSWNVQGAGSWTTTIRWSLIAMAAEREEP
jgi:hypothetical protein